jgi:hypothetical protein
MCRRQEFLEGISTQKRREYCFRATGAIFSDFCGGVQKFGVSETFAAVTAASLIADPFTHDMSLLAHG